MLIADLKHSQNTDISLEASCDLLHQLGYICCGSGLMGADPKFSQSTDKGLEARCDSLEAGCDSLEDVLHLLQI